MDIITKTVNSWINNNETFFGIPCLQDLSIKVNYNDYLDKYWNNDNPKEWCVLRKNINDKIKDVLVEDKTKFEIDFLGSNWIIYYNSKNVKHIKLFIIPIVYKNMLWQIGNSFYSPRGIAIRNNSYLNKIDNKVYYPGHWLYDIDNDTIKTYGDAVFESKLYDYRSNLFITTFTDYKEGEDLDIFKQHLKDLPDSEYTNILNYIYYDYTEFFNKILLNVESFNSVTEKVINCNQIISKTGRITATDKDVNKKEKEELCSLLILNNEKNFNFSISNLRSVLFYSKSFSNNFFFTKTSLFFDSFKVSTNKNAGKLRNLLDDVHIGEYGILYKTVKGKTYNMFEAYKKFYLEGDDSILTENISVITRSPFCYNDGPKRMMMTSKAYSQSIEVNDENSNLHTIRARVLFADFFGYTIGDGLVISESFAKRLTSTEKETILMPKNKFVLDNVGKNISLNDYINLVGKFTNKFLRYRNIKITGFSYVSNKMNVEIEHQVFMAVGDKLTNLHGAKGVVGLILPDNKMPKLIEDFGDMKAGPFEVISSSYGVKDRSNIGQILEAYSNCNTKRKIKELVEYNGHVYKKAFGEIDYLRLHHFNVTHASFSPIENSFNEMLNLGEMEKINLQTQGLPLLLEEIDIRSNKESDKEKVNDLLLGKDVSSNIKHGILLDAIKSLGFSIKIE